jgi:hypothetical protein
MNWRDHADITDADRLDFIDERVVAIENGKLGGVTIEILGHYGENFELVVAPDVRAAVDIAIVDVLAAEALTGVPSVEFAKAPPSGTRSSRIVAGAPAKRLLAELKCAATTSVVVGIGGDSPE